MIPYLIIVTGYILTILTSGYPVKFFIGSNPEKTKVSEKSSRFDVGAIIGKCENFIILTFTLTSAFTALAVVFTAKSIVRRDDIKRDPKYYLGGTLVNFCYSLLMGFIIKLGLQLAGY